MNYPAEGQPAIVVEVLEVPVLHSDGSPLSAYYRERLDIKIGVISAERAFHTYLVPSERFESFS
jgi:hypothetical protein